MLFWLLSALPLWIPSALPPDARQLRGSRSRQLRPPCTLASVRCVPRPPPAVCPGSRPLCALTTDGSVALAPVSSDALVSVSSVALAPVRSRRPSTSSPRFLSALCLGFCQAHHPGSGRLCRLGFRFCCLGLFVLCFGFGVFWPLFLWLHLGFVCFVAVWPLFILCFYLLC